MCRTLTKVAASLFGMAIVFSATAVMAQLPIPTSSQFDITGILQEATLGIAPAGTDPAFAGGTLTVNAHTIVVPANTLVQYPANVSTWAQMFALAPAAYHIAHQSGMALADFPAPLASFEVHVVGNRVVDPVSGAARYIAGLVTFSQEALNAHAGFINYINYANGEMRVGGIVGNKTTGTRVRINDPKIQTPGDVSLGFGRYSKGQSPDIRFMCDQDNPTIRSITGYPMGLPRTDPAIVDDPVRPRTQRPIDPATGFPFTIIDMPPVAGVVPGGPDPRLQAPFMVGDYITYSGTLVVDDGSANGTIQGPNLGGAANTYISAHTIIDNCAIYTAPGDNPAYVAIDVTIVGTGGVGAAGVQEATTRTRFEGFSTDPTRNVYLFGIDLNPADGTTFDRNWGSINVDPGAPTGAVRGRWRFRPPPPKVLTMPTAGTFDPPTREVRAVIATFYSPFAGDLAWTNAAWQPGKPPYANGQPPLPAYANGIISGQYHAPISDYLFPEQVAGSPIPPMNFETFRWLAQGGQIDSASNLIAGQLNPWPGNIVPGKVNGSPIVTAGANQTVNAATTVTLAGSATDPNGIPLTLTWTQTAGASVALSAPNSLTTTFFASNTSNPQAPVTLTFQLTAVQNTAFPLAPVSASVTITVNPPGNPAQQIAITGVTQRVSKQRLTVTANAPAATGAVTMTTVGATDGTGKAVTITAPMTLANGVYTADIVGSGYNATSVIVNIKGGGSAQMFNTNPLWLIR